MPRGPTPKESTPVSPHLSHYTLTHSMPEMPSTPAPTKARITHLEAQITELVSRSHAVERKHKSEADGYLEQIAKLKKELKEGEIWKIKAAETEKIKAEGEAMREELNLHSLIQQQKALLAVVNEQMDVIDMEYRGLQEQSEKVMRDYKITLFEAREEDLTAEIAEKDAQMAELEASLTEANTSKAHLHAAETKAAREESRALAVRVAALEKELKMVRESEKAAREREQSARAEVEAAMRQDKHQDGAAEKERAELRKSLREIKSDLGKKDEQLSDLQEEFAALQEASKEREKTLKAKIKETVAERDRLVGVEVELESLKTTHAKVKAAASDSQKRQAKVKEPKSKKTPAASDSEDEIVPAKKPRRSHQPKAGIEKDTALMEMSTNDPSMLVPTVKITDMDEPEVSRGASAEPEKKKKRKLFGAAPTFTWDPIMSSGDGVIPACLSPVKPSEKTAAGTIPRKGFGTLSSSRSMSRLI